MTDLSIFSDEILLQILTFCSAKDVLIFGTTSRDYNLLTKDTQLWASLTERDLKEPRVEFIRSIEIQNLPWRLYKEKRRIIAEKSIGRCQYIFLRGTLQGTRCPKQSDKGSNYCSQCSKKKIIQMYS